MKKYETFTNEDSGCGDSPGVLESEHSDISFRSSQNMNGGRRYVANSSFPEDNESGQVSLSIPDPAAVEPNLDSSTGYLQRSVRRVVEHLGFRILSVLLVVIDISILIADLSNPNKLPNEERAYEMTALCFVCYFVIEVLVRIFAKGPKEFFSTWFNVVDLVVIILSFIVTVTYTAADFISGYAKLLVVGRLIRIVIFVRLCTERKHLEKGARQLISQNKRRYRKDGFDLDLTYVTARVIAMSFPSRGQMSFYRNPIREVARFLDTKHKDHYKVYNLCSERTYDDTFFHGRVERYIIDDHNVPVVKDMVRFAKSVKDWLDADKDNVIAVHCKGGKGRTGTMICIWIVQAELLGTAEESLNYFGKRRTDLNVGSKFQGVETPSQSRYVGYFETIKEKYNGVPPEEIPLKIQKLKIYALAGFGKGNGSDLWCEIFIRREKVFECHFGENRNCQAQYNSEADVLEVKLQNCPILSGDVKLRFQCTTRCVPKGYENCPFYFWFHTSFIEDNRLYLNREQLDNTHKPKTWKVIREKFAVELLFSPPV